jgi:hypothetical protein
MFGWLFRRPPVVPEHLVVEDVHYYLDGGTTAVIGTDPHGQRRVIKLTQHMFSQRGGVGWLYLDRYRVPRRSETERAVVAVLRACLDELRSRPPEPTPEPDPTEPRPDRTVVIYGSPDLAAVANMTGTQRMAFRVEQALAYIESAHYGKVTR